MIEGLRLDIIDGRELDIRKDADEIYAYLMAILSASDWLKSKGYGAIVLDSATELEEVIRSSTAWADACRTSKGAHNTFGEGDATMGMFRAVVDALKKLRRDLKVHFVITCILDVKGISTSGEIEEASPHLTGYMVAVSVCQLLRDIVVVGRMEKNGEVKHKFQFGAELTKASKDEQGRLKRTTNFSPRLTPGNPPAIMDADFKQVVQLKKGEK
jgi:hypothetical protein